MHTPDTDSHTPTHTNTHTHTHTHTHRQIHTLTHTHMEPHIYAHTHTCIPKPVEAKQELSQCNILSYKKFKKQSKKIYDITYKPY